MKILLLARISVVYLVSTVTVITNLSYANSQCQDDQKTLLLELKNSLTFDSSFSRKLEQWDYIKDCCKWEGVDCDSAGHVISLQLNYEAISSGFENSSNLVSLKFLQKLNLAHNSLSGRMPLYLFSFPSLEQLILSHNNFSGEISELPNLNLSNLVELDLSSNLFKGPIPNSFFNLESLEVLSLSDNSFSGTFQLKKIQKLHNLTTLNLSNNNLTVDGRSINTTLSGFTQLKKLSLASCNLHNFPDLIKQSYLSFLDLSANQIAGEIPSWIWDIGKGALNHLNLSHNNLVGLQKPYHIPNFLAELDIHSNQLQGELPLLPRGASYIDYSSNKFDKPIPLDFVSSNFFLIFLSIAKNSISGSIPTSICSAVTIQVLDFSLNMLNGIIPPCLVESISNLQVLNLKDNNFSGGIPDKFPSSCGLKFIDMSRNSLGGSFPKSLANCKPLEFLNVGDNNIEDSFPCMLPSRLRVIVLRSNRFYGELKCDERWTSLEIFDLHLNRFSGDLHHISFSSWKEGSGAPLRHSRLTINVVRPDFFYLNLEAFKLIDFSFNDFHGELPEEIGNLNSLSYLNLSKNVLTGTIPKSFGNMSNLEALDLSENHLTGVIPEELQRITFLTLFNVSSNNLVGKVPIHNQFATFDNSSYLGNPGLCGFSLSKTCSIISSTNGNGTSHMPQRKRLNHSAKNDSSRGEKKIEFALLAYVVAGTILYLAS